MTLETHSTRVAMLKALGAEQVTINGDQLVWGLFNDQPKLTDFGDREVWGQEITLTLSQDDAGDCYRGMLIVIDGRNYTVSETPVNENGMVICPLAKAH